MKRIQIWIAALVLATGTVAFVAPAEKYFEIAKSLDIFSTLFKEVNAYYVDDVDPKKLVDKGIQGMLESLDPYTDYIPEEEQEAFSIQTTGQYAGMGALIGVVNKKTVITHPYLGFPAQRAGLWVGDEIISVNGTNVQGKPTAQVSALLKGKPKTQLEVTVRRYGVKDPITFKIERDRIKVSNVVYHGMVDNRVGYIKLDDFTPGAGKEVEEAVVKLKGQGAKSLIIDLRDNPGGLLYEAVNIVNLFIPKGLEVVATKGKVPEWNKSYVTLNNPLDTEIPLAVLTSGGSASASEIVAGALQDYDRALLIGEKTFGKGLVQTTRPLAYNAQLKVTTAKYYIPSGRCIQALDYANRKSDGTVEKFADSLKVEFKTKKGRSVFDGGGLDPDILVKPEPLASAVQELASRNFFFEYATIYRATNPHEPATMSNFRLTEAEYNAFVDWVRKQPFEYATGLESKADELIAAAREERYYEVLKSDLTELKKKIADNKQTDWVRYKSEISSLLEEQIAFHYRLNAGLAEISLNRHKEILEAKRILTDSAAYQKMLQPQ
ncbi:MAG: S41 family peptidase [Bacteroidota bacterium]